MSPEVLAALPYVFAALIGTTVASLILTPIAIRLAPRLGAIDMPDSERRVHSRPIPRTGGLAVALSFVSVGALGLVANQFFHLTWPGRPVRTTEVAALFAGVVVGAVFGYLDDRLQLKARWQFIAQFVLAGIALAGGVLIRSLPDPIGPITDAAAMAATTLWIVGMLNSVNFVDGLDGLLAGISLIAVTTLGVSSLFITPQPVVAMLCALLAGALLGFLPYNFHPARVFIGTSGVFAVGYALAVLSVLGIGAKVAVALLVLGVPIIDTFWIILRRVSSGRSPFSADRGHFHHRLLDLGLSHRNAVLLIYLICSVLAVLSIVVPTGGQTTVFLLIVLGGGLVLYLLTRRAGEALDRSSYSDTAAAVAEEEHPGAAD